MLLYIWRNIKKAIILLIFTILCIINLCTIHKNKKISSYILLYENHIANLEVYNNLYEESLLLYSMDQFKLENVSLIDEEKNEYVLKELIQDKKMILHYSELNCNSCVDFIFNLIEIYRESIGKDNILIVASYKSWRDYYNFKRINSIKIPIYLIDSLKTPLENQNIPYLFVLNEDLKISHPFIPHKEIKEASVRYLELIGEYFNTEN